MSLKLTLRERQLIAAFRRCDDRGRHMVEQIARDQSKASCVLKPLLQRVK